MPNLASPDLLVKRAFVIAMAAAVVSACGGATSAPTDLPTEKPQAAASATSREDQSSQPTHDAPEITPTNQGSGDTVRLVLADSGNEARYLVREQLADLSFPSDAIGTTTEVDGALVVTRNGSFVDDGSSIIVDLASLRSDKDRRDNYVRQRVLETGRYPSAVFVPKEARGLDVSALGSGGTTFELIGDMTIHGVTKETTWNVTASLTGDTLTGKATTEFAFEDFGMTVPSVMVVLSVEDRIRLEFDLSFVIEGG